MAGTIDSEPEAAAASPEGISPSSASRSTRPAEAAAGRVWVAGTVLWASGLALSVFVIGRLFVTWRVTPHAASHQISLLGQRVSYPVANLDALIVLALALAGLAVGAMTALGAVRELAATRTLERHLAALEPIPCKGALVIDDERPQAFCAGLLTRASMCRPARWRRSTTRPWTPSSRTRLITHDAGIRCALRSGASSHGRCSSCRVSPSWSAVSKALLSSARTKAR